MNKQQEKSERQIRRGVAWNLVGLVVNKGASIVVRLIVARLLLPEDFGVIAMITVTLGLVGLLCDLGLKSALIQRSKDELVESSFDSVFWLLFFVGFFWMTAFMLAGIPLMVLVFDEPRLVDLAMVMGISIPLYGVVVVPEARLVRQMRFRTLVTAEMISTLLASITAIALVFSGWGVWALALQELMAKFLRTGFIWRLAHWRPRRHFSLDALHALSGFSRYMLGTELIRYTRQNMDRILIGALLGTASLGVYTMAFMMTETVRSQITGMISRVMFPAYSRAQADRAEVRRLYLKVIRYTTLATFPVAILMILYADKIVPFLFGDAWLEAVAPVQILSLASMLFALTGDPSVVLRSIGRPNIAFYISFWNTILVGIPAIVIATMSFGVNGAAWAIVFHYGSSRIIAQYYLRREILVSEISILKSVLPAFLVVVTILLIGYFLGNAEILSVFNG